MSKYKVKRRIRRKKFPFTENMNIEENSKPLTEKLLEKAEQCIDTFEYEQAQKFLERVLLKEPNNLVALESLSGVLIEIGLKDKALSILMKIIEVCPEPRYNIYFSIAQLHEGKQSIEYYEKGIENLHKLLANRIELKNDENENLLKKELSTAYCSITEIYMTDCCDDDDAEEQCKNYIDKSIDCNPMNPEGYQHLANYMLIRANEEEAKLAIKKSLSLWLPQMQAIVGHQEHSNPEEVDLYLLTYESRLSTSKLLIELKMYDEAGEVLDGLIAENDEVSETWFLLGWLNYLRGKDYWGNAGYYLKKSKKVKDLEVCDPQLIGFVDELLTEIGEGSDDDSDEEENDDDNVNFDDSESHESMEN